MSAPELTPVEMAVHDVLRRAITSAVVNDASKSYHFSKLSEAEKVEARRRLITMSNLHTAIRDGEQYPHHFLDLPRVRGWFPEYLRSLRSLFADVPDHALNACQVVSISAQYSSLCDYTEEGQGGRKLACESSLGDQDWHEHMISEHTRQHDQMGDGHSCKTIDTLIIARENEQNGVVR